MSQNLPHVAIQAVPVLPWITIVLSCSLKADWHLLPFSIPLSHTLLGKCTTSNSVVAANVTSDHGRKLVKFPAEEYTRHYIINYTSFISRLGRNQDITSITVGSKLSPVWKRGISCTQDTTDTESSFHRADTESSFHIRTQGWHWKFISQRTYS